MNEDISKLIEYKKKHEKDNIFYKEIIKEKILNNNLIIQALDNPELDPDSPADYLGENILPFYLIPETQTETKNYICFETSFNESPRYNNTLKFGQVIFYIICDCRTIYDKQTGIARHDLLAALIQDEFNWKNVFGTQIHIISDKPSVLDSNYAVRTLIFEQTTPNSIIKSQRIINKL